MSRCEKSHRPQMKPSAPSNRNKSTNILITFQNRELTKMRQLYIKQKVFSLSEKFTVKDQEENDAYYVEGSFMQIPKTYTVTNTAREEVAHITKKTFSFLPKFFVEVGGREVLMIKKNLPFSNPVLPLMQQESK